MGFAEEKQLLRLAKDGDQKAFDRLYMLHRPRIFATLIGRTRNREDAEDLAQVTFLRAYRGLNGFRGEATFSTWLMQIALNVCTTHLRAKQARRSWHNTIQAPESEYRPSWEPSIGEGPDEALYRKECRKMLESYIQNLPVHYRDAVMLRYVKDQSYLEIQEALDVPIGTVKTWLYRARIQLQESITESGNRLM